MEIIDLKVFENLKIRIAGKEAWHQVDILNVENKNISLSLPKSLKNFSISQVVQCSLEDGRNRFDFNGEIFDVGFNNPPYFVIYVPGKIKRFSELRKEKRFDVDYLALIGKLRVKFACVKDISATGIRIHSDANLEVGDIIGVKLFPRNNTDEGIFFSGIVAWKRHVDQTNSYGIEMDEVKDQYQDRYFELMEKLNKQ